MDCSISTSVSTVRSFTQFLSELSTQQQAGLSVSLPSSPRSSALPSPPDSPSTDSVSSFPSVSSSFFFSSAAASPGHSQPHSDHGKDSTQGLIIPSLTLPPALRRPTPFGQTMGDVRLLVLGSQGAGKSFLTGLLLEDNEDVVEVGTWEDAEYGKVLRASTDWIEHKDAHGLDKYEPTRNVEIVELPGYDHDTNGNELITNLKNIIHAPFHAVAGVLHPDNQPSAIVANLVSSSSTPLYTALIILLPSAPTVLDRLIIDSLGIHIPIITLPSNRGSSHGDKTEGAWKGTSRHTDKYGQSGINVLEAETMERSRRAGDSSHGDKIEGPGPEVKLSTFRPFNAVVLRTGLFHSPEMLALLRSEASDRFLRWLEVERATRDIEATREQQLYYRSSKGSWDKQKWESEWMENFSRDVWNRVREGTITQRDVGKRSVLTSSSTTQVQEGLNSFNPDLHPDRRHQHPESSASRFSSSNFSHSGLSFDPLHLPSIVMFSASILGPLRARMVDSVKEFLGSWQVRMALLGGFCVGLGLGIYLR